MRHEGPADWGTSTVPTLHRIANRNQRRLLWLIHKYPGLNNQELAEALDVTRTAVVYHVRRLVRDGLVVDEKQGPHKLHFPAAVSTPRRKALALLRLPSVREVALRVYSAPRISVRAIAEQAGMNPRTVRRALQSLRHDHLIHCEKNGRGQIFHLHPEVRVVLARWAPAWKGDSIGIYPDKAVNGEWPPDLRE